MGIGLIDLSTDGKLLSISDYEKAYDVGIAYDEVTTISTSLIRNIPNGFISNFKSLKEINLPDVRELQSNAFESCSTIEKITLKNVSVLSNASIFNNCSNLKQVIFANNVEITSNARSIFDGCRSLQIITDMICNDYIPQYAFYGCRNLKTIGISGQYSAISVATFGDCRSLANIYIGSNVEKIDAYAFDGCYNLENVNGQFSNLSIISYRAFYECSKLKNINSLIEYASYIDNYAFYGCQSLYSLSISGSPYIGNGAFSECNNLAYINAPNITVLRGLPYTSSHNFGSISEIYEVFSNSYFSGVLDLSTVTAVYSYAGLNIFSKIYLENCTSYVFNSLNIRGDKIEEFVCPNITSYLRASSYGFVGYLFNNGYSMSYYGNMILSKLIISSSYEFLSYDFPSSASFGFPSNKCLYSCIEELSVDSFDYFLSQFVSASIYNNVKYPLINNFDNLKVINAGDFGRSDALYVSSYYLANLSKIEKIYMHPITNSNYANLIIDRFMQLSSNIEIYYTDNYYSAAWCYLYGHYSVIYDLYFSNIDRLDFRVAGRRENTIINNVMFSNVNNVWIYMDSVTFSNSLDVLDFMGINSGHIYLGSELSNLKNINFPNFSNGSLSIIGLSESYISCISLPLLSIGEVDCQYIDNMYLGCTEISKYSSQSLNWVYISSLCINNLYLNNCSKILTNASDFGVVSLYAPLCNNLIIQSDSNNTIIPLESMILSEYVDDICIQNASLISYVNIKTSGSYNFSAIPFKGCTNLKNIYMSATAISGNYGRLFGFSSPSSMQNLFLNATGNIHIDIENIPKDVLSINCDNLSFSNMGAISRYLYNYTYIKANTITNLHSNYCYGNCLIELDTSAFLSNLEQLYSSGITENIIIKVKESLLESYNSAYSSYSSYLNFIAL